MARPSFKIKWEAHEYEHKQRSADWFWGVGIIAVAIAVTSIILGNIIFAILILIGAFALSIFVGRPPSTLSITVDEKGITRNQIHYAYSSLKTFWIDTDHPHKKIILQSEKLLMPLIIIPLGQDIDVEDLHEKLSIFLSEQYHELPFVERLLEYLGF